MLIEKLQNRKGHLQGLPTGFHRLDEMTAGWKGGEMIVLAARPGQGKTALALTFAGMPFTSAMMKKMMPGVNQDIQ